MERRRCRTRAVAAGPDARSDPRLEVVQVPAPGYGLRQDTEVFKAENVMSSGKVNNNKPSLPASVLVAGARDMNLGSVSSSGGGFPALYRLLRDVHSHIWQGGSPYLVKGVNVQARSTRRCRDSLALFVLHFLEREPMQRALTSRGAGTGGPLVD